MSKLNIVDMFCGGGGESTGLIEAAHDYNFEINLSAINHWKRAIETHSQNYPFAEHYCKNVQDIDPNTLASSKDCDLMWASPGCQHFSKCGTRPPAAASPRNLLEMQILGSHLRPIESEILGLGPSSLVLISPPNDSEAHNALRTTAAGQGNLGRI